MVLSLVRDKAADGGEREQFPTGPFTEAERQETRRVLRDAAYSRMFWSTFRQWLGWICASIIFVLTFWDRLRSILPASFWPFG